MSRVKLMIEIDEEVYTEIKDGIIRKHIDKVFCSLANGIPEDDFSEIVKRPKDVEWSHSPFTTDLTCPICREVSKKNIFNNFCPNCGASMKGGADMRNTAKPTKEVVDKLGECKCNTCKHNGTWTCNNCHCFDKYEGGAE